MKITLKRVYEPAAGDDGTRVLVERLWPRGMSKADAKVDLWLKDIAPSPDLRKWFDHQPERWSEFRRRYLLELENSSSDELERLASLCQQSKVTFVFAARDEQHNGAIVLKDFLSRKG